VLVFDEIETKIFRTRCSTWWQHRPRRGSAVVRLHSSARKVICGNGTGKVWLTVQKLCTVTGTARCSVGVRYKGDVCSRFNVGIAGSNPAEGMGVRQLGCSVFCRKRPRQRANNS